VERTVGQRDSVAVDICNGTEEQQRLWYKGLLQSTVGIVGR
jgi:hypothetical protein